MYFSFYVGTFCTSVNGLKGLGEGGAIQEMRSHSHYPLRSSKIFPSSGKKKTLPKIIQKKQSQKKKEKTKRNVSCWHLHGLPAFKQLFPDTSKWFTQTHKHATACKRSLSDDMWIWSVRSWIPESLPQSHYFLLTCERGRRWPLPSAPFVYGTIQKRRRLDHSG